MARAKKMKINLSEEVVSKLQSIHDELKRRGAKEFEVAHVFDAFVNSPVSKDIFDDFINFHTPEEYKIGRLLEMPEERRKIMELIKDKSFGLVGDEASSASSASH